MVTMWKNSLGLKVLIAYVAGAALSIVLIGGIVAAVVASKGDVLSGADVAHLTEDLARMLKFSDDGIPVSLEGDDEYLSWVYESLSRETAWRVLDSTGAVAVSSAAGDGFWPKSGSASRPERGRFLFEIDGVEMRGATAVVEKDGRFWYFQCAVSTRFMQLMYRAFALPFTGSGIAVFSLVFLVVFGVCAYSTLKFALKPLRVISERAAEIGPNSLGVRLEAKAVPTEIVPLLDSFNRVLGRLEEGYRIQQEFIATAAHELKTPLSLIRAQIELMSDGEDRQALLGDVQHMSRQVQQLLLLAEASERGNYSVSHVDVFAVAHEAVAYLKRVADAAGVRLVTARVDSGTVWAADRGALFVLFKNLLENAIQYAPRGTEVLIEVGAASFSVRDCGPGVDSEDLQRMFSRFWRGDHRRDDSAGLGLAICSEIAVAHGWELSALRADPGLRVCVSQEEALIVRG